MFTTSVKVKCCHCGLKSRFDSQEQAERALQESPMYVKHGDCALCAYCAVSTQFREAKKTLIDYILHNLAADKAFTPLVNSILTTLGIPEEEHETYENHLFAALDFDPNFEHTLTQPMLRALREMENKAEFTMSFS